MNIHVGIICWAQVFFLRPFPSAAVAFARQQLVLVATMMSNDAADSRTAVPEFVRHSLLLQEEIAKMSTEREEKSEREESCRGGSLDRWQGPYWWKSLKQTKQIPPIPR
eukprot:symbB.v1.2.010648.t1/scaffold701.1/size171414/4